VPLFRWVLLLLGILVVAGVFAYSRGWFNWRRESEAGTLEKREPVLEESSAIDPAPEPEREETPPVADEEVPLLTENSLVVTVRILPQPGTEFPAETLILALRAAGLKHGKFGIFHRHAESGRDRIRFSVASLVEPGSFDLSKLKESTYRGISIFMVLPAPEEGVELFDDMLLTARTVAREIDGRLVDEQGGALSVQRERYMREEVIDFLRRRQQVYSQSA
jgi:cell division protein ZipA